MKWNKQGRIYFPSGQSPWQRTHAQGPAVDQQDDHWRIYYSTRDDRNRSHIAFFDVDADNPQRIVAQVTEPVMSLGKPGTFDEHGVMPSCLVNVGDCKYLYYTGWSVGGPNRYCTATGLAVSRDGGQTFRRVSDLPVMGPTDIEPELNGTPYVLHDGERWRCWFHSCTKWSLVDDVPEPYYHIKFAESDDGVHWKREGHVAIDYRSDEEAGICRPGVIIEEGVYKMWFSYRNAHGYRQPGANSYRIGYADSQNGRDWTRKDDEAGIDVSLDGWDSEMIAYPQIVVKDCLKYLFYNGNGFGQSGIGVATAPFVGTRARQHAA